MSPSAFTTRGSRTIEDGIHTYDIYKEGVSKQKVGTKEFAEAVVARLGKKPQKLKAVGYGAPRPAAAAAPRPAPPRAKQETVGVDVYVGWPSPDSDALAARLQPLAAPQFELKMLTSRGIKVWPGGSPRPSARTSAARAFSAPAAAASPTPTSSRCSVGWPTRAWIS